MAIGLIGLVLFVVDRAQPLEEDAAVVLLLGGVGAVGVRSEVHHLLVDLGGLVIAAKHVEQKPFVIAGFERIRDPSCAPCWTVASASSYLPWRR